MPKMGDLFHEAEEAVFSHIHGQHANPQESHMPNKFADAKDALDRVGAMLAAQPQNQLAEAIADAGVGMAFTPGDIGLVLAMIRAIEHGPGLATPAAAQQDAATQQTQA